MLENGGKVEQTCVACTQNTLVTAALEVTRDSLVEVTGAELIVVLAMVRKFHAPTTSMVL